MTEEDAAFLTSAKIHLPVFRVLRLPSGAVVYDELDCNWRPFETLAPLLERSAARIEGEHARHLLRQRRIAAAPVERASSRPALKIDIDIDDLLASL